MNSYFWSKKTSFNRINENSPIWAKPNAVIIPSLFELREKKKAKLQKLENGNSLRELVEDWLERIPFLESKEFNFVKSYKKAVKKMVASEQAAIQATDILSQKYKDMRIKMIGDMVC